MDSLIADLNPEQRKAVTTTAGPLLVLAGAGTGKTRVITHRIAHMLAHGVPARSILAMTFTNKAAGEMKERIARLAPGASAKELTVGTFHAFCARSLREHAEGAGVRRDFGICDAADQLVAMKKALRDLSIAETRLAPRVCLARVSLFKNRLVSPEQVLEAATDPWQELLGLGYRRYEEGLRTAGLLDFDDLLLYMVRLLGHKPTLAWFRERFRHVFVDEYQDTNGPQYEIVLRLGEKHRNVCVVGDDDQSIYGWRGADVSKILNFEKDFPEAVVVRLETNYRSTSQILEAANAVIRHNAARHAKSLRSARGPGEAVAVVELADEEAEAAFVVDDILRRASEMRARLGAFAILFRTQVQPRVFEMRLRAARVPYVLVGGMSFFDRKEVRDLLAYLRLVANPTDELSLLRVVNTPPRGVGRSSVEKGLAAAARARVPLAEVFARGGEFPELGAGVVDVVNGFLKTLGGLRRFTGSEHLVELVRQLVRDVNYVAEIERCYPDEESRTARWAAVGELCNMAESYARRQAGGSLAGFIQDVTLNANEELTERDELGADSVALMTLHGAKGLEFDEVYLVGFEEGLLPHEKSIEERGVDEERRLAYVGMTRARRRLTLTFARSRARYGKRVAAVPSRFLLEMRGQIPPPAAEPTPSPSAVGLTTPAGSTGASAGSGERAVKRRRAREQVARPACRSGRSAARPSRHGVVGERPVRVAATAAAPRRRRPVRAKPGPRRTPGRLTTDN